MALGADMSEPHLDKPELVNLDTRMPAPSKGKRPLERKGGEKQPSESGAKDGRRSKSSPVGQDNPCPSREAMVTSQKRPGQSWAVSSCGRHSRSGKPEEKRRARPSPSRERGRDKPGSSHRRDSSHTELRGKDRRPQARSPVRTLKRSRSGDSRGAPYHSAKRRRQPSPPEASSSPTFSLLMSRVVTKAGGLQVALDDLQAPGGAFLRVPSSCTEPTVSQRAWITWQLSHAGAALHWALHTVDSILAEQARLPRHHWPPGDSFMAGPSPAPTSSPFARPRADNWCRDQASTPHLPALPRMPEAAWTEPSRPEGPGGRP